MFNNARLLLVGGLAALATVFAVAVGATIEPNEPVQPTSVVLADGPEIDPRANIDWP
ncbi:hypothetical protein [Catellatospora sichuanensis]|uniref:hypothetical protein n=1 Tax=Catellatospora sichuanensis TaxID=1969805 RepID=UPI001643233E|nr:hypothetical protein [Catellatospora sichuanensis]